MFSASSKERDTQSTSKMSNMNAVSLISEPDLLSMQIVLGLVLIAFPSKQMKIRRKKNVKKGIQFSLMVCGASGTGAHIYLLCLLANEPLTPFFRPNYFRQYTLRQACSTA